MGYFGYELRGHNCRKRKKPPNLSNEKVSDKIDLKICPEKKIGGKRAWALRGHKCTSWLQVGETK